MGNDEQYNLGKEIGIIQNGVQNLNDKFDEIMKVTVKQEEKIGINTTGIKEIKAENKSKHSTIKDVGIVAAMLAATVSIFKVFWGGSQ